MAAKPTITGVTTTPTHHLPIPVNFRRNHLGHHLGHHLDHLGHLDHLTWELRPQPLPLPSIAPTLAPPPPPKPTPSFDPVAARPANNARAWVTQSDYRSSWIARDYAGTVGFRLNVGASGRVEGCSVTQSSGVAALDEATCQLVTRRARFDPAKNGEGRAVAGSYNGAVRWQLPD